MNTVADTSDSYDKQAVLSLEARVIPASEDLVTSFAGKSVSGDVLPALH